jgi:hypothetical protein
VRAQNLHAWVEADLDGTGFQVLDPTPPAGLPPAMQSFSLLSRLSSLGREIEFFYDRHILGFDSGDQVGAVEAVRESLGSVGQALASLKRSARELFSGSTAASLLAAALGAWLLVRVVTRARRALSPATRAYLALRRVLGRLTGEVAPSLPPAEVARLFAEAAPSGRDDASTVVEVYCANAFGGIEPDPDTVRDLSVRVRRLKKLA